VGSIVQAEEYIHGKLHKLKFVVTKIVPNVEIEYVPTSRILRRFFPRNAFHVESREGSSVFRATGIYRVG
jgi:hypothetical protein